MATVFKGIAAPVGIRNGIQILPNTPADLAAVTDLFDRITFSKGGTKEIGGLWAADRTMLIAEVADQIVRFQTANALPVIDGAIDPAGRTLKLMNQLADDPAPGPVAGLTAAVVPAPEGYNENSGNIPYDVADVTSLAGFAPLRRATLTANYLRKLVRVDGTSIRWFGVLMPCWGGSITIGRIPHIHFTPTPVQGGYPDSTYESFGGWGRLWADYTHVIGSQMVASGADQILVIPFYKTGQSGNLGDFLVNWRQAVAAAVTAAVLDFDLTALRTDFYEFDSIVSSSFSNGYVAHQNFNNNAAGASSMTGKLFDLDGQAGGSMWRPPNGIIYLNRGAPGKANPVAGMHWYVGGRWSSQFAVLYGGNLNTHACCRNHLLLHGLWTYCT